MFSRVKLFLFTTLIFLFLCTCETKQLTLPIAEESLIKILCDVHVIEGALQNQKASEKDSLAKTFYDQVYEKHDISEEDFVLTLEIMEKDPKLLQEIYDQVLVELDSLEERSYKSKYKKNKVPN